MYECSGDGESLYESVIKPCARGIRRGTLSLLEYAGLKKRPAITAETKVEVTSDRVVEQSVADVVEKSKPTSKRISSGGGSAWFGNL